MLSFTSDIDTEKSNARLTLAVEVTLVIYEVGWPGTLLVSGLFTAPPCGAIWWLDWLFLSCYIMRELP